MLDLLLGLALGFALLVAAPTEAAQPFTEEELAPLRPTGRQAFDLPCSSFGGLDRAAVAELGRPLSEEIDGVLAQRLDFFSFCSGEARVRVVLTREGGLEAFSLRRAPRRQVYLLAVRVTSGWYDRYLRSLLGPFLARPVETEKITSRFGERFHPLRGESAMHYGIDYGAELGTPVRAVADGEVLRSRYRRSPGHYVALRHEGGYTSKYLHMKKRAPEAVEGARVRRGQVIGWVGQSGSATGPHLHFELVRRGRWLDPAAPRPAGPPAPLGERAEIRRALELLGPFLY